jgi:hypothetical protein
VATTPLVAGGNMIAWIVLYGLLSVSVVIVGIVMYDCYKDFKDNK